MKSSGVNRCSRWLLALCVLLCSCASARYSAYVVEYRSVDQNGDSLTLSGKVTVPTKPAKGVILLPHYTIAAESEAPSNAEKGEQEQLREDYVLVIPDYIGYGASRDRVHPYLRGDLTAKNCVDMLLAVGGDRVAVSGKHPTIGIDTISILGFSQGGATALWCLKLIEEEYSDRIHVKSCYAGSGPHDVAATYDEAIRTNRVGLPLVIPMLVLGTSEAYGLNLEQEKFFTPAMNKMYNEYINTKNFSIPKLFFRMLNHDVSYWLSPYGMNKTEPETQRMYEGLQRSSLVYNLEWQPKAPVYVFHSKQDDIVTARCAEALLKYWQGLPNVTFDLGNYGNHLNSYKAFFPRAKKRLAEDYKKK